jgi:hypothetical protein
MLWFDARSQGCGVNDSSLSGIMYCIRRSLAVGAVVLALASCSGGKTSGGSAPVAQPVIGKYAALEALPDWSGTWANEPESVGLAMRDCCLGDGAQVPFTPKYAQWRRKVGQGEADRPGGSNRNNSAMCIPAGMPAVMAHPILFEFLLTPGRVTMVFNDGEIRSIDTALVAHPPMDDIEIGFSGHSIGHWEHGTLVIDTVAIDPRADIFMSNGMRVTANTHLLEQMTLAGADRLKVVTTIADGAIFTKPFSYTRYFMRVPGGFVPGCAVNNIDNGVTLEQPEVLP